MLQEVADEGAKLTYGSEEPELALPNIPVDEALIFLRI
jgi:hypothetical protein